MTNKTVELRISTSTNPAVSGRYFCDLRDTTNGANRQMTTRTTDDPAAFVADVKRHGAKHGVIVTVCINTLDLSAIDACW